MATSSNVLISGAGIAGPTLAYWLARAGYPSTLIERAAATRSSGSPVDVRNDAVDIVRRMGVMPRLLEVATEAKELVFVDERGRRVGRIAAGARERQAASREVEVPRGELARVLRDATRDDAEYLFHDTITSLIQDAHGVDVTFERAAPRRFDLVIGADGLHSRVRGLIFGPESKFISHRGLYVATLPFAGAVENAREITMFNAPGRSVTIHPARGNPVAAFIFRSAALEGFDHRDVERHRSVLAQTYGRDGWRVPELLHSLTSSDDLYFDSVSQVRIDRWSDARVALLGDAASCVSLFGDGSTLAIIGAHSLAEALAAHRADPASAFAAYERAHRPRALARQRGMSIGAAILVPATATGIHARNLASRVWSFAASARP